MRDRYISALENKSAPLFFIQKKKVDKFIFQRSKINLSHFLRALLPPFFAFFTFLHNIGKTEQKRP
ncbi:hypothetical protein BK665_13215 [Pseudomonas frederiksbergensis]|uniref:Uncharacterized protein n=1 Tax=Pseudomonas frederiksbergensis TaxID=104087 RepID=A0A423KKJ4_9PSED|nr:hypothetical protein BK665_13215 [Pseudomonas frederiksbergensis]